ncbi:MAG: hypothetical protein DKM50_09490 [Candidatus Margulisiibacteriota bacterium]|nr:MAG: hypothetical protein DKM50_09490 [Candidatus Margulisiibacteriota bacterium]
MGKCCGREVKLLYACSGAADVGEISDRVVRKLRTQGFGAMTCLAAVGAGFSGFVASAKGADKNITIDGCSVACAKKTLENLGVTPTAYVLTEMGLTKGQTPVTEEVINEVTNAILKGPCCSTTAGVPTSCACGSSC